MLAEGAETLVVVDDDGDGRPALGSLTRRATCCDEPRARRRRPGDPELRAGQPLRDAQRPVLHRLGARNWGDTLQPALVQHIELAAIAVAIGFVIAFVAALVAYRFRLLEPPFGFFTAFLYTIPSLALFQLLVPVTGLTGRRSRSRSSLHAADPVPEHARRPARGARRRARGGARDGAVTRRRSSGGSSCRWRCRRSSPACASRP